MRLERLPATSSSVAVELAIADAGRCSSEHRMPEPKKMVDAVRSMSIACWRQQRRRIWATDSCTIRSKATSVRSPRGATASRPRASKRSSSRLGPSRRVAAGDSRVISGMSRRASRSPPSDSHRRDDPRRRPSGSCLIAARPTQPHRRCRRRLTGALQTQRATSNDQRRRAPRSLADLGISAGPLDARSLVVEASPAYGNMQRPRGEIGQRRDRAGRALGSRRSGRRRPNKAAQLVTSTVRHRRRD